MKPRIDHAAVLGAGVMGAQIAAHLANAGVPTTLLDLTPGSLGPEEEARGLALTAPEVRNRLAAAGLEKARKIKPAAFFLPEDSSRIRVGNLEDHLGWLGEADWIIEAVAEDAEIKRGLLARVASVRRPGSIVSSNTSGIPIAELGRDLPSEFRAHLLGTHFFNPPRYLRLLELVRTSETSGEVACSLSGFCDRILGKGIVYCKDTPNFIANRIGVYSSLLALRLMQEEGFTIAEIDAMTGPILGRPKSATFRTFDLAGLDTAASVATNLYQAVPHDERRETFIVPELLKEMIGRGWIGDKAGQGFYRRDPTSEGGGIHVLDYTTMSYEPKPKVRLAGLEMAAQVEELGDRLRLLLDGKDRVAKFLWQVTAETLIYAANRIPEIADDIVQVDRAMRWGFNHQLGPFELWDAIGVEKSVARMTAEGRAIPVLAQQLLASGRPGFYRTESGRRSYFDLRSKSHQGLSNPPGVTVLADLKAQRKVIRENAGASLIDLGDGVACLEFHTKMNAIGADIVQMMSAAVKEVAEHFEGLVIGNQAEHFCVGANLVMLLLSAQEGEWEEIDLSLRRFQQVNLAIRRSAKPVVVATAGMTLGAGCEIALHAHRVRAAAESYLGLVEAGVGLVPAGGGTREMLARTLARIPAGDRIDPLPHLKRTFELIGMAKVSGSAAEAGRMGFLRETDAVSMNRDRLIEDAKQDVLGLSKSGYRPPFASELMAYGEPLLATLKLGTYLMMKAGYLSEYDRAVGNKLAWILCGGNIKTPRTMPESYFLELERQAFLSLCGERKTQERIQHMLKTGKPLRN
ncbi:MAG: enoyl-CoA hydratase/isomerase family protein [Acidobacteria bacterium]|nr:enoyl-CoA hydratase/isomerase family protein [Acidobacteriota bacterium]